MTLAFLLTSIRRQRAMSGERLAQLCGTNRQQINEIEHGHWNLSVAMLDKLATGLKVDPAILLACALESMREAENPEPVKGPVS